MKSIIFGVLLASPPVAVWAYRSSEKSAAAAEIRPVSYSQSGHAQTDGAVRIPIEIIEKGSAPKFYYVESTTAAVPEPGIFSLLTLTSLVLVFRRRRG